MVAVRGGGNLKVCSYYCNYFASRGTMAVTVTYRLRTKEDKRIDREAIGQACLCSEFEDCDSLVQTACQRTGRGPQPHRCWRLGGGHISLLGTTNG